MLKKLIILRCDYGRIKGLSYGHYSRLKILEKILRPKFNIVYLIKKNKFNLHKENEFYFNTIYENKRFGRNMYMFSFPNIIKTQISRIVFKLESTSIGGKLVKFFR